MDESNLYHFGINLCRVNFVCFVIISLILVLVPADYGRVRFASHQLVGVCSAFCITVSCVLMLVK